MKGGIAIGFDHAGVVLKPSIVQTLQQLGVPFVDLGTASSGESVDYPDFAAAVADKVSAGEVAGGILACGTGLGMSIVANKHKGVRAAVAFDEWTGRMAKEHNNANVLCLGGRIVKPEAVGPILKAWFSAEFQGDRHSRRLEKIRAVESKNFK